MEQMLNELFMIIDKVTLEELDKEMKNLTLELIKYEEDTPTYKNTLVKLSTIYNIFESKNNNNEQCYYTKYADLDAIRAILTMSGYLSDVKKTASR